MDNDLKIIYSVLILGIFIIISLPSISSAWLNSAGEDQNIDYLDGNLTGHWTFNGTTGILVDSLELHDGTANGSTMGKEGLINNSWDFSGKDSAVVFGDFDFHQYSALTACIWVYPRSDIDSSQYMGGYETGNHHAFTMYQKASNHIIFFTSNTGAWIESALVISDNTIAYNQWSHLCGVWDGSTNYLYVNGTLQSDTGTQGSAMSDQPVMYMGYKVALTNTFGLDGLLDEAVIFNSSLNGSAIGDLYNNGSGITYSPGPVDTCTCAGLNNNWEVDMSDFCELDDACELGTGKLSFTGTGYANCSANINTTNLGDPGAEGILWISSDCLINIKG